MVPNGPPPTAHTSPGAMDSTAVDALVPRRGVGTSDQAEPSHRRAAVSMVPWMSNDPTVHTSSEADPDTPEGSLAPGLCPGTVTRFQLAPSQRMARARRSP